MRSPLWSLGADAGARAEVVAKLKSRVVQVCEKSFGNQLTDAAGEAHCRDFGAVTAAS